VPARVAVYVDGFNLYNGLKEKHGRKYLWLDLQALATSLLLPGQALVAVHYYSARVRGDASGRRQADYIDALAAHCTLLAVEEGRFQEKRMECRHCGAVRVSYEEKETDVSIAVALVEDAFLIVSTRQCSSLRTATCAQRCGRSGGLHRTSG
jgi:hypothetical protein